MPKKKTDLKYFETIGRRKSAVARVRLYLTDKKNDLVTQETSIKKGEIVVNKRPFNDYFPGEANKIRQLTPLSLTESADRFAISIKVAGGGKTGQLEASILGISRALQLMDPALRPILKKNKLLTRNPRVKERRKVGTGGKARRQKQSPKR